MARQSNIRRDLTHTKAQTLSSVHTLLSANGATEWYQAILQANNLMKCAKQSLAESSSRFSLPHILLKKPRWVHTATTYNHLQKHYGRITQTHTLTLTLSFDYMLWQQRKFVSVALSFRNDASTKTYLNWKKISHKVI